MAMAMAMAMAMSMAGCCSSPQAFCDQAGWHWAYADREVLERNTQMCEAKCGFNMGFNISKWVVNNKNSSNSFYTSCRVLHLQSVKRGGFVYFEPKVKTMPHTCLIDKLTFFLHTWRCLTGTCHGRFALFSFTVIFCSEP